MYKLPGEIKKHIKDNCLVDQRKKCLEALFIVNSDWDAEVRGLCDLTWNNCWSYGVMLDEFDVIKILKKYGKYNKQDEVPGVWEDGRLSPCMEP